MALDVNVGFSSINSGTLSSISAISGHSFTVKTGRGSAELVEAGFISANAQYGRITGADIHSGGIYVPAAQLADARQSLKLPHVALPEGSVLTVEGYHNAGSSQSVFAGLTFRYNGQYKTVSQSEVVGKRMLSAYVGNTTTSGVPSSLGSITTNLKADKEYAVLGVYATGANLKSVWLDAPELNGMRAGGVIANTGTGDNGIVDFVSLGECPVVSGRSPATLIAYSNGADQIYAYVFMVEL